MAHGPVPPRSRWTATQQAVVVLAVILTAPMLGSWLAGGSPASHFAFPPRPPQPATDGFSWPLFVLGVAVESVMLAPVLWLATRSGPRPAHRREPFPAWGIAGALLLALAWIVAWSPLPDTMDPVRRHSFTPLWVGYVVAVQAWTQSRTGSCLLRAHPGRFLALFPASAAFWWLFEYLNGFVGNWVYLGTRDLSPLAYALEASLPFTTVLPAVVSTRDLLVSFPGVYQGLASAPPGPSAPPAAVLAAATAALVVMPTLPGWLYPLLWLAPAFVVIAVQALGGRRHLFTPALSGDWRAPWLAALSGLVCGFLWEMWNWGSLARWGYHIPHLDGVHVFAMPLLGYGGYLPFGVTCMAVAGMLCGIAPVPELPARR